MFNTKNFFFFLRNSTDSVNKKTINDETWTEPLRGLQSETVGGHLTEHEMGPGEEKKQ